MQTDPRKAEPRVPFEEAVTSAAMSTPAPASAAGAAGTAEAAKLAVWKEALYERCREAGPENGLFSQDDLLQLDVIPNKDLLLLARVVQSLSDDKLFVTMRESSGQVLWKWRDAQEAHKLVSSHAFALGFGPLDHRL